MPTEWIFSLTCLFLPPLIGSIHAWIKNKNVVDTILFYYLLLSVGLQELIDGSAQVFAPQTVSRYTHWSATPFVQELGMANITFGLLALMSLHFKSWRTPVIVGLSIFYLLTGMRHVVEMTQIGINQGNFGGFFVIDFLMPLALLTLLYLQKRRSN